MSYTDADLRAEISAQINSALEAGDSIMSDWVAMSVIKVHMPEFSKHDDFLTNAVWGHVRKMVGAEVRRFRFDDVESGSRQPVLPGFEMLQEFYEVQRQEGNTVRAIRVHRMNMTTAERREQARSLISNGRSLIEHGNQLDRETDELIAAGLIDPDND